MYSNSVATWVSGSTVNAGQKRGWAGQVWTAVNTTTAQPAGDSADWIADIGAAVTGITISFLPDNRDFMQTKVTGVTLIATHVSKPPEVCLCGLTLTQRIQQPYFKIITPTT